MSLFGGGGSQATAVTRYNALQLSRSAYGAVVPLLYGQCRAPMTLIWYGDFVSTPVSQSSGGKGSGGNSGSQSYNYSAAMMMMVCEGPIAGYVLVYDGKAQHANLSDLNLSQLALGTPGQAVWSYLTANHPGQAVPYDHVAYAAAAPYQLGSSAGLPNLTFEIAGLLRYNAPTVIDAEPAAVAVDYMTDLNHGANFFNLAPLTGANSFQQYCVSMGMFVSYLESSQRAAVDFLRELLQITNSAGVVTGDGLLHLVPYADSPVAGNGASFTPNLTPKFAFTDDDLVAKPGEDPVRLLRQPYSQTFNVVNVEYEDRANQYNTAIASAYDDADVALNGPRVMSTVSLHAIKTASLAKLVAQLILQRNLYYRNHYQFTVRPDYAGLEPMDFVALTDSGVGAANVLCRVLEVNEPAAGEVELLVEEVPVGPATAPLYDWQASQGYAANYNSAPGPVNAPYLFRVPPGLSTDGQARLGIAVNGPNNGLWAGANVWVSFDNANFQLMGAVVRPARYGTLAAPLPSAADPDTTSTLAVALNNASMTVLGGSAADADQMRTLCVVDGELISYQSAAFVSAGRYNLGTRLRRGCYGSTVGAHASGAQWARLDQAIATLPLDPGMYGATLYLKFQSFNVFMRGLESLASLPVYTYVPAAGALATESAFTTTGSVVITGSPAGYRVYKPAGSNAWDSNANSVKAYSGGCWVSGQVAVNAGISVNYLMLGLTTTPNYSGYVALNFALYQDNGLYYIYESGALVTGSLGVMADGDIFSIVYDGRIVRYAINGIQVRAVPAPGLTLYASVAVYGIGAQMQGVEFGAQQGAPITGGNFLSTWPWKIGTSGSQGNYQQYSGGSSQIILGDGSSNAAPLGPFWSTEALWKSVTNTGNGSAAGFFDNLDTAGLDPTKTYRFALWIRFTGANPGYVYIGTDTGASVRNLSPPGTVDPNPYFIYFSTTSALPDTWYLAIGIIHGSGFTGGQSGNSGLYDPATGDRVSWANGYSNAAAVSFGADFKFNGGAVATQLRAFGYTTAALAVTTFFARPRFEEMNGHEPSLRDLITPNALDPSLTPAQIIARHGPAPRIGILPVGSIPPMVQNNTFSYTSTTSSVTLSWNAYLVYRPDGSSFPMVAGSKGCTGLPAGSSFYAYAYSAETAPATMLFVTGLSGEQGSPAVVISPAATYAQLTAVLAAAVQLGNIYQGRVICATTAAGAGGGGGGGGGLGCLHPDQRVLTSNGVKRAGGLAVGDELLTPAGWAPVVGLTRPEHHEWLVAWFDNDSMATVTMDHRFVAPDGEQVRARDLRLNQVLSAGGPRHLRVTSLRLREVTERAVALELADPHTYLLAADAPLSHNLKP